MSKAIKSGAQLVGLKRPSTQEYGGPSAYSTPYSSVNQGVVNIDPSVRLLQDQALQRTMGLYGNVGSATDEYVNQANQLRSRFLGNQNAFTQARVNPLQQELTTRQGALERSIGLRGLSGSSFGEQALTGFGIDKQRALGDERAKAEMESIAALQGIDKGILSAILDSVQQQSMLNNENYEVAGMRLEQELAALGLGQNQINQFMDSFYRNQENKLQAYGLQTQRLATTSNIMKDAFGGTDGAGWMK